MTLETPLSFVPPFKRTPAGPPNDGLLALGPAKRARIGDCHMGPAVSAPQDCSRGDGEDEKGIDGAAVTTNGPVVLTIRGLFSGVRGEPAAFVLRLPSAMVVQRRDFADASRVAAVQDGPAAADVARAEADVDRWVAPGATRTTVCVGQTAVLHSAPCKQVDRDQRAATVPAAVARVHQAGAAFAGNAFEVSAASARGVAPLPPVVVVPAAAVDVAPPAVAAPLSFPVWPTLLHNVSVGMLKNLRTLLSGMRDNLVEMKTVDVDNAVLHNVLCDAQSSRVLFTAELRELPVAWEHVVGGSAPFPANVWHAGLFSVFLYGWKRCAAAVCRHEDSRMRLERVRRVVMYAFAFLHNQRPLVSRVREHSIAGLHARMRTVNTKPASHKAARLVYAVIARAIQVYCALPSTATAAFQRA